MECVRIHFPLLLTGEVCLFLWSHYYVFNKYYPFGMARTSQIENKGKWQKLSPLIHSSQTPCLDSSSHHIQILPSHQHLYTIFSHFLILFILLTVELFQSLHLFYTIKFVFKSSSNNFTSSSFEHIIWWVSATPARDS